LAREEAVPALRALRGRVGEPHAALSTAFVLGRPVTRSALAAALPALGVDGAVRPLVDLRAYAAVDAGGRADW
jgi:hypothetical protein